MEEKKKIDWQSVVLVIFVFLGFIASFFGGVMLQKMFANESKVVTVTPPETTLSPILTPVPTLTELPEGDTAELQLGTGLLKDKAYFDDSIMLVSTETPRKVMVASVTRSDRADYWQQNSRVSIFDGDKWTRKTSSGTAEGPDIYTSRLVKSWKIDFDASRVLKMSVKGEISVEGNLIGFETGQLTNEIGMRSLPGYTKFMSNGTGYIVWEGKRIPAKLLYTRIYSMNSTEIQFYTGQLGLTTDWVAFWDVDGNFYHVDKTSVDRPTEIYKTHEIGVMEDKNKSVTKTFAVGLTRDDQMPPEKYEINLTNPIGGKLSLTRGKFIDKAPNTSYNWYMGLVEGVVKTESGEKAGFGIVEYIHD